jgi:hypothetical protein
MESLRILVNKLTVSEYFNTDLNSEYTKEFAVGETVRKKYPQRFLVRDGLQYSPQPINRTYTTVTVDQVFGIDFEWDSVEAALKMERGEDEIRREYIEPAMAQLAQEYDSRAALWALQNTNNVVGALGTNPTTMTVYDQARARLSENACPPGKKVMNISPQMQVSIGSAVATVFNPQETISDVFKEGLMGRAKGFDWYESNSLYTHTAGTWAGTVEMSSGSQSGSTITVTATTGDTFLKNDVISIAGVYNVNPATRRSTGTLKQFVITASTTAVANAATLSISPAIVGPGSQYQNVDSLPANGADLTLFPGTTSPNGKSGVNGLAFHRDAFALVGVKMEKPKAAEISTQFRDPKTGIAIRFVRMFDPQQSKMINRFDTLCGFGNLYNDNCAVRVLSQT